MASPPHVPQLNIPRKRGSIGSANAAAPKKRKPSQLRNSLVPDREAVGSPLRYSRSPSVDSVATNSVVNGAGGRKRKRKDGDTASVTGSMRGGRAKSAVTGVEGDGGEGEGREGGADGEEEEDDLEDEMDAVLEGGKATEATKKQEKEHERLLLDAMSDNQERRYETYRRIRLKRETVRKLVNQTLSQSVPQPVIIAVTSYSKAFIGQIIDLALTVRDEWCATRTHLPNPDMHPQLLRTGLTSVKSHRKDAKPTNADVQGAGMYWNHPSAGMPFWKEVDKEKGLGERLKMEDKGPLTPAHLREALRRYKRDREGGGAGFAGMSLEGVERTMARTGGKRLFR